ncbi:MAG: histidine kinase [Spirosomataceae bacterium]
MLLAFAFCLLLCYGLSSVVYFVLEAVNPKSPLALINKGVFYSNIANSFATFCSIYTFIYLIDNRIRFEIVKYAVLIGLTFLYVSMFQWLVWWAYWRHINVESFSKDQNNGSLLFGFIPHIVSCLYFAYWQRTRHISRKISEQEYQLLNLEKLKTKAQLNALEARINPHFLYNSLNSIAGLVHQDPDKAEEMTIQLSKLFRYSTGRSEGHSHSIAEELEVVKSYLAIEQMRFGNRLQFSVEVTPELMYLKIPRFLLQPIVENAIKHGISQLLGNGKIEIKITQEGKLIQFTIHDNGPAFKEAIGGGYGLRSIKDKLNLFYGEKAQLQIQNNHYKAVCITLPMDNEPIEFR